MKRLAVVLALVSSWAGVSAAQGPRAGEVRAVVPVAHIVRGTAPPEEARRLSPVFWQDVVRTQRGGRARLGLNDGSILNVGSESELRVLEHDAAAQRTALELSYGRMRATVVRLARTGADFQVRSRQAVAGVVGTEFIIRSTDDYSEVFCLDGQVRVRNADPSVAGEVILNPGEYTRVVRGQPPTPPRPATPEELREAQEETDLPIAVQLARVEISWPPAACGEDSILTVRGWEKRMEGEREIESPVDGEMITGTLRVAGQVLRVEGGRAILRGAASAQPPDGQFTPHGAGAAVVTKIWPPLEVAAGEGWRAPRAVFVGSAFYVLGPMRGGSASFAFGEQPATLLWAAGCGAAFLAPALPGAEYTVALRLGGEEAARGPMNLISVSYRLPTPPVITRGARTSFWIDIQGLTGLDRFTGGRPVLTTIVTNRTPAILGNLSSRTRGASATGEMITFRVGGANVGPGGIASLEGNGIGHSQGTFMLGVDHKLDPALEQPRTPLAAVPAGAAARRGIE
jgi:hypothetical protein